MTGPEIVKEYGAVLVPIVVALVMGLAEPLRKLMDRHPVVRDVAATEQVTQDVVTAVRLAVNEARAQDAKAFKDVLDRMEARELHLTDANEALIRQAEARDAFHEREIIRERNTAASAVEDAREARFEVEKAGLREKALQDAALGQDRAHTTDNLTLRRVNAGLRGQLEDYVRRYGALGGKFTATDVVRDDS